MKSRFQHKKEYYCLANTYTNYKTNEYFINENSSCLLRLFLEKLNNYEPELIGFILSIITGFTDYQIKRDRWNADIFDALYEFHGCDIVIKAERKISNGLNSKYRIEEKQILLNYNYYLNNYIGLEFSYTGEISPLAHKLMNYPSEKLNPDDYIHYVLDIKNNIIKAYKNQLDLESEESPLYISNIVSISLVEDYNRFGATIYKQPIDSGRLDIEKDKIEFNEIDEIDHEARELALQGKASYFSIYNSIKPINVLVHLKYGDKDEIFRCKMIYDETMEDGIDTKTFKKCRRRRKHFYCFVECDASLFKNKPLVFKP